MHGNHTDKKLRVFLYWRASKADQKLTREVQQQDAETWCAENGGRLIGVYGDVLSGGTPLEDRPGLLDCLAGVKAEKPDVVLVWRRDRLARNMYTSATVDYLCGQAGARVVSVTEPHVNAGADDEDPSVVLMRGMLDLLATYERLVIRMRTKAAIRVRKAQGVHCGRSGIRGGKRADPAAVGRVRELLDKGMSERKVVDALAVEGVRTSRWTVRAVRADMERERIKALHGEE